MNSKKLKLQSENQYSKIQKVENVINNLLSDGKYINGQNYYITIEDENNLIFGELENRYVKITGKELTNVLNHLKDLFPNIEIYIIGRKVARFILP